MNVIAFPSPRLTPDDLALFERIASPMLKRGLWSHIRRDTGPGYDKIEVEIPEVPRPLFTFERVRGGRYRLVLHERDGGTYEIGRGMTAKECLRIWHRQAEQAGERGAL
ncbi:MAG TPA: hypothetical protein VEY95_05400 [Azospirillaceae bacterium]|nr:hypothetical protein [Azospirillaceae bacterium]